MNFLGITPDTWLDIWAWLNSYTEVKRGALYWAVRRIENGSTLLIPGAPYGRLWKFGRSCTDACPPCFTLYTKLIDRHFQKFSKMNRIALCCRFP